jgi:hypothetical protein
MGADMKTLIFCRLTEVMIALATSLGVTGGAIAADMTMPVKAHPAPVPAIETWTFSLTPYVWATSLSGHTTVKGVTTDIDASFFDILDHTEFPKDLFQVAAFGEARYGRLALLADLAYMKVGVGPDLAHTRGTDKVNGSVGASAGLTVEMFIAEFAAAYEVARWGGATSRGSITAFDLYAGGRAWWQRGEARVQASGTLNIFNFTQNADGTLSASDNVNWVDPVVGARLRHQFVPGLDLSISGDIGGFDVGSKFSWQALATLNYEFAKTENVSWTGMIGYKALSVDYSKGSGLSTYEYDMTMYGPIFGVTARF